MSILVTGGAGFIGIHFILNWLAQSNESIINLDKLTYASNLDNLSHLQNEPRYTFIKGSIGDSDLLTHLLVEHQPRAILNFAAESHVDRSITDPQNFIQTNIIDTFSLLEVVRHYWESLADNNKKKFRFLQVSTDEVYGSLERQALPFTEQSRYQPNSPYSASKAAGDHLVRAYFHTYGLPVLTTHSSNNFGPYQFPEKLIPLIIHQALKGTQLPIYGDGQQIRDWLYVEDHCNALRVILKDGLPGQRYNIGASNEMSNLDVVCRLCELLDTLHPRADKESYKRQIAFIKDRPGHDRRYAIDASKLEQELGWTAKETFDTGLYKTVQWYLEQYKK